VRYINVIGAFTVLVCNLVVSYNHSIQLFHSGGFHGWMAHMAVIGSECTFVMGALNIVVSRLKGVSPGVPAMLGGLLGVALVSWSNMAAGWEYGITGVLLGLATPASLIVAEAILSRAILQRAAARTKETPTPASKAEVEAPSMAEPPTPSELAFPAPNPTKTKSPTPGSIEYPGMEPPAQEKPPTPATSNVEVPAKESPTPTEAGSPTPSSVEPPCVKSPGNVENDDAAEEIARAKEIARRFKEEYGRLPGRRKLAEIAGCREWYARKALDELRKTA
jgi:hypothetical protein